MIVSRAVTANLSRASWIRRMFEEGARLKQERGADKVFDFTLGNPEIEKLEAAITPRTRVILVNSPNSPSGVIYPRSTFVEIETMLARAARPIVLVSDEPYRALVFDDVAVPEVPPLVTRAIVATS